MRQPQLPLSETSQQLADALDGFKAAYRASGQPTLTIIVVIIETMSLATAKARFSELVDRVERQQDRVIVTRNGKPAAVVVSPDDLESLKAGALL